MLNFLKKLLKRYGEDDISGRAAALSYFTIFSLGPLLFLILGIVGLILRNDSYKQQLLQRISDSFGYQAGSLINSLGNQNLPAKTTLLFVVGGVGLVLAAIGIFGQLQKSLNVIMHIKPETDGGPKKFIQSKLLALGLVGIIALLLIISLLVSSIISAVAVGPFATMADFGLSVAGLTILFALLYQILIRLEIAWGVLLTVSLIVAMFVALGKALLALIIGHNASVSAFGAAGSLVALLLWIFYLAQIIYLGAVGLSFYLESHPKSAKSDSK